MSIIILTEPGMLLNGVEHDGLFIKMSTIMSPIKELSPLGRQIKTVRKKIRLEMYEPQSGPQNEP